MRAILSVLLILITGACSVTPERLAEALNDSSAQEFRESSFVPVYIATTRAASNAPACKNQYFGVKASEETRYVICETNVPKNHSVGALDETDDAPDRDAHFFAPTIRRSDLAGIVAASQSAKQVLVFVHGFNVKFEEAVYRAAQIKYDLRFKGPVVLFTWPAGSDDGILSSLNVSGTYEMNFQNARKSRNQFREFITALSGGGSTVHLIVHSMGHQVVIPALTEGGSPPRLGEVIFNAPDFALEDFKKAAPILRPAVKRITLYCSPGDNALVASEKVNGGKRIGRCAKIPDVDVVNVNEVDSPVLGIGGLGHGYYSGRAILTDVYQVLLGVDVSRRLFVRKSSEYGGEDYVLRR